MISVDAFKIKYPQFASVPDATVQVYLDDAELILDEGVWGNLYTQGVYALACHEMTLSGLGTVTKVIPPNVTSKSIADVSVSFKQKTSDTLGDDYYNSTPCGAKYLNLSNSLPVGILVIPATGV